MEEEKTGKSVSSTIACIIVLALLVLLFSYILTHSFSGFFGGGMMGYIWANVWLLCIVPLEKFDKGFLGDLESFLVSVFIMLIAFLLGLNEAFNEKHIIDCFFFGRFWNMAIWVHILGSFLVSAASFFSYEMILATVKRK